MLVREIMSSPVAVVCVSDTLDRAAQLMWNCDCGVVPVVDEGGRAVAMLTDRDICMAAYTQGKPLAQIPVGTAMSGEIHACWPETSVVDAEQLMRDHQIRRLPVLNEEKQPVGLVSLNDVARAAVHQHPGAHGSENGVSVASTAQTLAAVCAHRLDLLGPPLA